MAGGASRFPFGLHMESCGVHGVHLESTSNFKLINLKMDLFIRTSL